MNKKIKGALLSALVFPGIGQLYIGKKILGIALVMGTNIGMAGVVISVLMKVKKIMAQIPLSGNVDVRDLANQLIKASMQNGSYLDKISLAIIVTCWFISVIHVLKSRS